MSEDSGGHEAPTRRDYMKYGGAVVGGTLLAGCAGESDSGSTSNETSASEGSTLTETATAEDQSYSVTMSPMGTVEFDSVPETVVAATNTWPDILVALNKGDNLVALPTDTHYTGYYNHLDGVSFDISDVGSTTCCPLDMEQFYEFDADIHHFDPVELAYGDWSGFSPSDVERIKSDIGPFFMNRGSRRHNIPEGYDGEYQFYTLWEIVEKAGQVYREQERAAQLKTVRDEMVAQISESLPPASDRPSVGTLVFTPSDERFYPDDPYKPGYERGEYDPLQPDYAFSDAQLSRSDGGYAFTDVEGLLEVDPDVIIQVDGVAAQSRNQPLRDFMADNPVAQELTAVQNDRVHIGGSGYQGPIYRIFQLEMAAKQIYPDEFGEWPKFTEGPTPEIPEEEQLFDRQRVADIINGDF